MSHNPTAQQLMHPPEAVAVVVAVTVERKQ